MTSIGVRGKVKSKPSNESIADARVFVYPHAGDAINVTSDGEFLVMLLPGDYEMEVSADGYTTVTQV